MAIPTLPLAARTAKLDARNPTLIPNLDTPVSSNQGTIDVMSPAAYLAANPRTDASVTVLIGGTITTGNTPVLTLTNPQYGSIPFTYTVAAGDTTTTVAEAFAKQINDSSVSDLYGIRADLAGVGLPAEIIIYHNGPAGNSTTVSASTLGTLTATLAPSNGIMTGGSGPIVPTSNFVFGWNGVLINFWYGVPRVLGSDLVNALVAQGMPIV